MPEECIAHQLPSLEEMKQTFGDQKFTDIREFEITVTPYTTRTSVKVELGSSSCKVINVSYLLETVWKLTSSITK